MHPSISARAYRPLIKFIGKRNIPSAPAPLHAHPAAPSDAKKPFAEFVKKSESSASQPTSNGKCEEINLVYNDFWEVPSRFWRRGLEDTEIDAILSGGASLHDFTT